MFRLQTNISPDESTLRTFTNESSIVFCNLAGRICGAS